MAQFQKRRSDGYAGFLSQDRREYDRELSNSELITLYNTGSLLLASEADSKLVHRWVLDDVASGTVTDSIGNADGTVNGVSSLSGDFAGGSAGDGDGVDDFIDSGWVIEPNFRETDFAVAFTIANMGDAGDLGGIASVLEGGANDNNTLEITFDSTFRANNDDTITFAIRGGASGSYGTIESSQSFANESGPYRIVLNKISSDANNWEIWINQTQGTANVRRNSFTAALDFVNPVYFFARNQDGAAQRFSDHTLDDICVFGDSLTTTEIKSYQNPF